MEKIAAQGGWKEAEKTMTAIAKIKPQAWKAMGATLNTLKDLTTGGTLSGFRTIGEDFKEILDLALQDAFSEFSNEIDQALAEALEPIMPEITAVLNEILPYILISVQTWKAIITGDWDEFMKWMNANVSDELKHWKNEFRKGWDVAIAYMMKGLDQMGKDWAAFWADPFGGLGDVVGIDPGLLQTFDDLGKGWAGFWGDIGKGWSGFWSDLGWK